MNEIYLKKIDQAIEDCIKKKSSAFNMDMLINYIVSKINSTSSNEESNQNLENILMVRLNIYYPIRNFFKMDSAIPSKLIATT